MVQIIIRHVTGARATEVDVIPVGERQDGFLISDLGSRNGTFLNGERIQHAMVIHHGDRLRFGEEGPEVAFEVEVLADHWPVGG